MVEPQFYLTMKNRKILGYGKQNVLFGQIHKIFLMQIIVANQQNERTKRNSTRFVF